MKKYRTTMIEENMERFAEACNEYNTTLYYMKRMGMFGFDMDKLYKEVAKRNEVDKELLEEVITGVKDIEEASKAQYERDNNK